MHFTFNPFSNNIEWVWLIYRSSSMSSQRSQALVTLSTVPVYSAKNWAKLVIEVRVLINVSIAIITTSSNAPIKKFFDIVGEVGGYVCVCVCVAVCLSIGLSEQCSECDYRWRYIWKVFIYSEFVIFHYPLCFHALGIVLLPLDRQT